MGLQSRVPVPQTPFLGVLGLYYIRKSHSEGHRGPKSASRVKSPIMDFVAAIVRRKNFSRPFEWRSTFKIRVLCDPSAPIPPAGPRAPTQARNAPNARNRNAQSNISLNFIFLHQIPATQTWTDQIWRKVGQKWQTSLRTRREHEATRRAQKVVLQSG